MLDLEARRLMAATVVLPFKLDFSNAIAGTTVDKDGQGTGFQTARAGTSSQIDINTAKGILALTADYSASKPAAALETAFDGSTRGFTISARLLGPLSTLLHNGDQAGLYFGPDLNNCVRLTAVYTSAGEKLQLATIVNGQYVGSESATYVSLPLKFSQITTLDLQLTGDAVTGQVVGRYSVNGKKMTALSTQAVPAASKAAFFHSASETGVIVSDKHGPVTAVFDSFSIDAGTVAYVPVAVVSRSLAAFSDLTTTGAASGPQTVRVTNNGDGDLLISGLSIDGPNAGEFTVTNPPNGTITLKTGQRYDFYVTFKTSTANSIRNATLSFNTNDPSGASTNVALRGLGLAGAGGSYEPALQRIIDVYGFKTATGQSTSSNAFDAGIRSADEVKMPQLTKAGGGDVTLELLGVFANQVSRTTIGWYEAGNPQTTYRVGGVAAGDAQSLSPLGDGMLRFDPGAGSFGLYGNFTLGSASKPINRNVYSEDALNTWETNTGRQQKVRFYKLRDADGNVVANSYVVAFEEYNVTFDQNDIVALVRNVQPAAAGAEIGLENLDNAPFADRLVMSRVRDKDENLPNEFHDTSTLRVRNTGSQPLNISDMVLSNADFQIVSGGGAHTIAPNGYADVVVKFVYNDSSNGNKLRTATLTIKSNDADESAKVVTLAGLWQSHSENQPNGVSAEPTAEKTVEAFGYSTKITYTNQKIDTKGVATAVGDEVLSELWQRADTGLPVTARMLATYHQQYDVQWNTHSTLFTYDPKVLNPAKDDKPTLTKVLSHNQLDSQSVLPRLDGSDSLPAQASFIPGSAVFGFNVDGYNSTFSQDQYNTPNDANNPGHGWRFYVAKDAKGNIIPDTYIACQDYVKVSWANYDYQDNIILLTNVKPVSMPQTVQQVTAAGTSDGVAVTWRANTANDVTSYNVYRRIAGSADNFIAVANVAGTSFADTAASAGTSYEYAVTAVAYQGGESALSVAATAKAGSGQASLPTAPGGVAAVANSSASVTVTWKDNSTNETGFRIERKAANGTWASVGTVNANVLTFTDGSVSASTSYAYRVIATSAAGDSASSNETAVATPAATPATPVALTGVDIGSPKPAGKVTTVTAAKDYDVSVGGVDIFGTADSFNFAYQQKTGDFDVAVRVSGLAAVDPSSQAGLMVRESLAANAKNVNIKAKSNGLRLTYRTSTGGSTTAVGSGDANFPNVYLRLQRVGNVVTSYSSTDGVNWTNFGSVTVSLGSTVYVGLATCGKSQTAAATANYRGYGDTGSTTGSTPTAGTATPTDLVATATSSTSVALTWADNADNETGYRVERQTAGVWAAVATLAANTTAYTDTTVSPSTVYNYRVVATGAPDSAASALRTVTTPGVTAGQQTLTAIADAYVFDGSTSTNYGSAATLQIKKGSTGYNRQGLVKFDVSGLSGVNTAKLRLFANLNTADTVQIAAYGIASQAWAESAVTNANKPPAGGLLGTATVNGVTGTWIEIDLSAYVKQAVANGQTSVSLSLQGTASSTAYVSLASRESGNGPQLVVA